MQAFHEAINLSKVHQAKLRIVHIANEFYAPYVGTGVDYERLKLHSKNMGKNFWIRCSPLPANTMQIAKHIYLK
ncbi:TPA: hypothetical protein ACPSKY_003560 [Legionella bozemanae]|uniref:hypothetical protein n=1 Tax=Legionella bozemanae TaxID=447 RepID=UPI00216B0146|nr:hypothetical protein [Legionella bozemanae]